MHKIMLFWLVLALQGCAVHTTEQQPQSRLQLPATSSSPFRSPADIPALEQLFSLSDAQQQDFLSYFHSPSQSAYEPEYRLQNYLQNKLLYFSYEGANHSAQVALEKLRGNCMTLALLTSALARLAGIEVGYQLVYQEPLIDYSNSIFITSSHIRTYLYQAADQPKAGEWIVRRAALVIDYFPDSGQLKGATISQQRFYAMLYNNLAADALLQGNTDQAFHLSQTALQKDNSYSPAVNMIALMYHRKGAIAEARLWFNYGMQLTDNQITLLTNYRDLAKKINDQPLLEKINQQLLNNEDDNPYAWLALAIDAERNQQMEQAKRYYKKLLEKAPYLHNANLALIRLYLQEQNFSAAQGLIEQAMRYAYEPKRMEFYQTKLSALKQHRKALDPTP